MGYTVTVRNIDPADKAWLRREARQVGVSMEEFVRRLIREKGRAAACRALHIPTGRVRWRERDMTAPMAWLLDANIVSEMMRPNPEPRVAAFLDTIAGQGIGLASITVWEILNGIGRLDAGHRRDDLARRFQDLLDDLFEERILAWALDHARTCARITEQKRRRGEPLDDHLPDAFLAAMAAHAGLAVVTRNPSQFRNTGAQVVDPWAGGGRGRSRRLSRGACMTSESSSSR